MSTTDSPRAAAPKPSRRWYQFNCGRSCCSWCWGRRGVARRLFAARLESLQRVLVCDPQPPVNCPRWTVEPLDAWAECKGGRRQLVADGKLQGVGRITSDVDCQPFAVEDPLPTPELALWAAACPRCEQRPALAQSRPPRPEDRREAIQGPNGRQHVPKKPAEGAGRRQRLSGRAFPSLGVP